MIIKTGSHYLGQILLVASFSLFSAQLPAAENQAVSDSLLYPAASAQATEESVDKEPAAKEHSAKEPGIEKKDAAIANAVNSSTVAATQNQAATDTAFRQNQVQDSLLSASGLDANGVSSVTGTAPEAFGLNNGHSETVSAYNRAEPVSIGKFLVYSFGVLGLIFLLAYCLRRLKLVPGSRAGNLGIITALAVGQKEKLVLVRVGNEQLLVGVTPHSVNLVYRLPEPLTATGDSKAANTANTIVNSGFNDILARFHREGNDADANADAKKTGDLNSEQIPGGMRENQAQTQLNN